MENQTVEMFCPYCHEKLIAGKKREFETLSEHVSDPNMTSYPLRPTWICENNKCPVSKEDVFWDESGDFYGWNKNFKFENDISSAYPSLSRRLDIEIYKKGLKRQIYLSPAFMLWLLQPIIEFNYKADDYGNVLKRTWKLKWLKKECWYKRDGLGYHIYYTFPIVFIINHIKRSYRLLDGVDFNQLSMYGLSHIIENFDKPNDWDKRWWRHFEIWLSKIIFKKKYYYVLSLYENKKNNQ